MNEQPSLAAFGVELKKLKEQDLPMLCHWRNHPEIFPRMVKSRQITLPVLSFWYNRTCRGNTGRAYIAYLAQKPCAYVELKKIDLQGKSTEYGIFLFGREYMGTGLALKIVLCLELVMDNLGLRTLVSRIYKNNTRSIYFNEKCGATITGQKGDFLIYTSELEARRSKLQMLSAKIGLGEEFCRYFGKIP